MKKIFYSAIALFTIFSCSEDVTNVAGPQVDGEASQNMIDVRLDVDITASRSSVSGATTTWEDGDQLALFHSVSYQPFVYSATDGFAGQLGELTDPAGEIVSAIYPYDAEADSGADTYNYTIATSQAADYCDTPFMFGRTDSAWFNSENISIVLKPLTSIVEVTLTGIPAGVEIASVDFRSSTAMPTVISVSRADGAVSYSETKNLINVVAGDIVDGACTFRVQVAETALNAKASWSISPKAADDTVLFTYNHTFPHAITVPAGSYVPMDIVYPNMIYNGTEWVSTIEEGDTAIVIAGDGLVKPNADLGDTRDDYLTITEMFAAHTSLITLDIRGTKTTVIPATGLTETQMQEILLPNSLTSTANGALKNNDLRKIVMPVGVTTINQTAFADNHNLKYVELKGDVTMLNKKVFVYNSEEVSGIQLVLRGVTAVPKLGGATNTLTGVTDVYVPADLVDEFQNATDVDDGNQSAWANVKKITIHSLEELAQ